MTVWFTTGLALWRRVVRTEPAVALAIFALTLVAGVLVTFGARLLDNVSGDDLVADITSAAPRAANIQIVTDGRLGVGPPGDRLSQIADRGQQIFDDDFPESVQEIVSAQQFVAESPPFRVSSFPDQDEGPFTRSLRFRFQSNVDDHMTVVDGRAPDERRVQSVLLGAECPRDMSATEGFVEVEDRECRVADVPVYEVVVSAQTAADLLIEVGDTVVLRPEVTSGRWAFIRAEILNLVMLVEIVGVIELTDPSDEYWFGDDALHRPRIIENPDFRLIFASAVTAEADYRMMIRDIQEVHFDYAWRYGVDAERIDQSAAADLAIEIDKLGTTEDEVVTQLPEIINQHLVERALTVGLMSTAFAGVLVVSAAAAFVLASLAADRQHHAMRLLLDRGVGRAGLRWTGLWHGLVVTVPAVAISVVMAAWVVGDARWTRPLGAGVLIVVGIVGSVVASVWLAVNRAARGTVSGPRSVPRSGTVEDWVSTESQVTAARRLVRDTALLIVAVGAVVLVRRRSVFGPVDAVSGAGANRAGGGSLAAATGSDANLDLLMAVAPPAIGLAVGVVAIRLMAPLFRGFATLGARRRGVVPFVGFRRLLNQGRAARSAVVIVVMAVGIAGFAATTRVAVRESQWVNGWQLVGADVTLRGQTLNSPVPEPVIDEARSMATAVVAGFQQPATGVAVPPDLPPVELLAVEADGYRALLEGSPIDPTILDRLIDPVSAGGSSADTSTANNPIPAVISRRWAPAERPSRGEQLELQLGATSVAVEVVAVVDHFPATPFDRPVVIVDLEALRAAGPPGLAPTTVLFVEADSGDPIRVAALTRSVSELDPTVRTADRLQHHAEVEDNPFVRWTDIGLRLLTGFAVGLAALSVVSTLAISAPTRRRDLGLLSTMGLESRQAALVTMMEQLVPITVAASIGAAVGAGLFRLIVPALNLTAFSGGPLPVEVTMIGSTAALVALIGPALAVVGAVLLAVLVSTWRLVGLRRSRLGGDEGTGILSMGEV